MDREHTCCFTGHRPDKLPWGTDERDPRCVAVFEQLTAALDRAYAAGCRHFICGMARGGDLLFCRAALALRDRQPGVTVEGAIPCQTQADRWPANERARRTEEEIVGEANRKAAATLKKADEDIAFEKKRALNELKNEIAGISLDIAEKVIGREIREDDHKALIDGFIDEIDGEKAED